MVKQALSTSVLFIFSLVIPGSVFSQELHGRDDIYGPYEVVENWPRPMSESLPGHEDFSWSVATDVFAQHPDRVFIIQNGELPVIKERPDPVWLPEVGPGLRFPIIRLPIRQAGFNMPNGDKLDAEGVGRPGIDWRYEHCVVVVNSEGYIVEEWSQWDHLWVRPHDVEISPYDPDKHVWIVDADGHAVYKFTNDGKELVLTLGTPRVPGEDDKHFNKPTFLAFMDENTMYLADGYDNTRVIKYDMDGNILAQWGKKGSNPRNVPLARSSGYAVQQSRTIETRPGYFNNVHGLAVDPTTRRVYVNDRENVRVQVFDENGNYLHEWKFGPRPPVDIHSFIVTSDRKLWAADQGTHRMLGYDLEGKLLYTWGTFGDYPGAIWGVHGMSTDSEGNLYTASVNNGRVQKFRPRKDANPDYMVGKPWPGQ